MASSTYRPAGRHDTSPTRRAMSFGLAVAAHLLVIWLLLHLGNRVPKQPDEPPLSTFALDAEQPNARAAAKATETRRSKTRSSSSSRAATTPPPRPTPPQPSTPAAAAWPTMLADSFDLAKVPKGDRSGDEGRGDDDARGDSATAYGPGSGPGGQRLYNADWQREPTDAEVNGYIHTQVPPGSWAIIACKTAEDNRVENCRSLDEAPPGSGFASSMRQAAWQFRVLPPRVGGRRLIGAWVRICFDFRRDEQGRLKCPPRRD